MLLLRHFLAPVLLRFYYLFRIRMVPGTPSVLVYWTYVFGIFSRLLIQSTIFIIVPFTHWLVRLEPLTKGKGLPIFTSMSHYEWEKIFLYTHVSLRRGKDTHVSLRMGKNFLIHPCLIKKGKDTHVLLRRGKDFLIHPCLIASYILIKTHREN